MSVEDQCSVCQRQLETRLASVWFGSTGEKIETDQTVEASALIDSEHGEVSVCERCYHKGLPDGLSHLQRYQLHYEFALDYRDREEFETAELTIDKALELHRHPDALAVKAYLANEIGDEARAEVLYVEALELDAEHGISKTNLDLLRRQRKQRTDD